MAIIGYSPWNDAANVGAGIGQSLGNILLKMPMMRREVALEERKLDLQQQQLMQQQALDKAHSDYYRAQTEEIPRKAKREENKERFDQFKGLGDLAIGINNSQTQGALREKQGDKAVADTALAKGRLEQLPIDAKTRELTAKANALVRLVQGGVTVENAKTARAGVNVGISRVNADPMNRRNQMPMMPRLEMENPLGGVFDQLGGVDSPLGSLLPELMSGLKPQQAQTQPGYMSTDPPPAQRDMGFDPNDQSPSKGYEPYHPPAVKSTDPAPPGHPYKVRSKKNPNRYFWATPQEVESNPDLEVVNGGEG